MGVKETEKGEALGTTVTLSCTAKGLSLMLTTDSVVAGVLLGLIIQPLILSPQVD
ncbi:hypothetical protein KIN20_020983 [Parelaphostrongylus tenuis]|uniref:Uncharacterized protein n=1 Tax=Parelaphostrongylus tenuis TaxID=148309 RepID=A0AAD5N3S6_PARTN|nr:hypothetical protein KIN20_020976 [Parelaphostrongylus tenuis]KAJ1361677.1 hypothetical protein KIN20_020983 [Parelaphostrongylus tenuis]